MRNLLLICLFAALSSTLFGQAAGCDGSRYLESVFSEVTVTSDLNFGSNIDVYGSSRDLLLDVYEPTGDTETERPMIMMVHGGTFIGGTKDGPDVKPLAEEFAKMGYVTSSIYYRLGLPFGSIDSVDIIEATLRGVHDTKAAVRYFYKDRQTDNLYKVDTNRIYVLGVSAGGIIAVHLAYLDDIAELPADVDTTKPGLGGGMPGLSGNLGYSDRIAGIANISGALGDTAWMKADDEPIVSIHSPDDDIVPYGTDMAYVFGFPLLVVDGSETITMKAEELGLSHCMYTEFGGGHTPHVGSAAYQDTLIEVVSEFFQGLLCDEPPVCAEFTAVNRPDELPGPGFSIYPNPAAENVMLEFVQTPEAKYSMELISLTGQVLSRQKGLQARKLEIKRNNLPAGMYFLKVSNGSQASVRRIVFE